MPIAFNQVPPDLRVPWFAAEINSGPPEFAGNSPIVLIGRADDDYCEPLTLVPVGSEDPNDIAGPGTMGADQILHARRQNRTGLMYFMSLPDPENATFAEGSLVFSGKATKNGVFTVYIAGQRYDTIVRKGDMPATVATNVVRRINGGYVKFDRQMRCVLRAVIGATTATVRLVARQSGFEFNAVKIQRSLDGDERGSPGITAAITQPVGGVGSPELAAGLATLTTKQLDWFSSPYSTDPHLDTIRDFFAERWNPMVSLDGHYITVRNGTLSDLTAFGLTRNDPHATIMAITAVPHPPWVWAASLAGEIAFRKNLGRSLSQAIEIVRPMQTLVLSGLRPPPSGFELGTADRQALLSSGLSTFVARPDGQVACDRIITTYQLNDAGLMDTTFLDIESVATAAYTKRYFKNALLGRYPRHAMREDNPTGIVGVVTPDQARGCVIHAYEDLAAAGIVRQSNDFAANARVEFDYGNSRANFYLPVALSDALRVFAANITLFRNFTPATALL